MPVTARNVEIGFNLYQYPNPRRKLKAVAAPSRRHNGNQEAESRLNPEISSITSNSIALQCSNLQQSQAERDLPQNDASLPCTGILSCCKPCPSGQFSVMHQTLKKLYPLSPIEKQRVKESSRLPVSRHGLFPDNKSLKFSMPAIHDSSSSISRSPFPSRSQKSTRSHSQNPLLCSVDHLPPRAVSSSSNMVEEEKQGGRKLPHSETLLMDSIDISGLKQKVGQKEMGDFQDSDSKDESSRRIVQHLANLSTTEKDRDQSSKTDSEETTTLHSAFLAVPCTSGTAKRETQKNISPASTPKSLTALNTGHVGTTGNESCNLRNTPIFTTDDCAEPKQQNNNFSVENKNIDNLFVHHRLSRGNDGKNDLAKISEDPTVEPPFRTDLRYLLDVVDQSLASEAVELLEEVQKIVDNQRFQSDKQHSFQRFALLQGEQNISTREIAIALADAAQVNSPMEIISQFDQLVTSYLLSRSSDSSLSRTSSEHNQGQIECEKVLAENTPVLISTLGENRAANVHPAMCVVIAAWAQYSLEQLFSDEALGTSQEEKKGLNKISAKKKSADYWIKKNATMSTPVRSEQKEGVQKKSRLQHCFQLLDEAVEAGHLGAMYYVGCCLRDGKGLPTNLRSGINWIERAATAGYVPAIHEMGEMLESGVQSGDHELDPDWGEAMIWYHRAAERNYSLSQLNLGKLLLVAAMQSRLESGWSAEDRERFLSKGKGWLHLAASSGNLEARHLIERIKDERVEL